MSVKMKLGIWEDRKGDLHFVDTRHPTSQWPWRSKGSISGWTDSGRLEIGSAPRNLSRDLVRFISDLPAPASAESGAAGSPTVSTGDPRQTLRRMRKTESAMRAEAQAHHDAYEAVTRAADDLEAEIIRLEKEVEG